jgi:hypothetical protein
MLRARRTLTVQQKQKIKRAPPKCQIDTVEILYTSTHSKSGEPCDSIFKYKFTQAIQRLGNRPKKRERFLLMSNDGPFGNQETNAGFAAPAQTKGKPYTFTLTT